MKPIDLLPLLLETLKAEVTPAVRLEFDEERYASIVDETYDYTPEGRANTIRGVLDLAACEGFNSWIYISNRLDVLGSAAWDAIDIEFDSTIPKNSSFDIPIALTEA